MASLSGLLGRPAPRSGGELPGVEEIPLGGPSVARRLGELAGALEAARLLRAAPWLGRAPRGDGGTVIDLPGWKAPEASNLAIRTWLRRLGYDAHGWGLGTNDGDVENDVETLVRRLRRESGEPVCLIGWSLGGVVAREVARSVPERVARVITYGSPIVGGPSHTLAARAYGPEECARIAASPPAARPTTRSASRSPRSTPAATASSTGAPASTAPHPTSSTSRSAPPT
jgi:pimeloyl-ACP methyl ester carboxylesterase